MKLTIYRDCWSGADGHRRTGLMGPMTPSGKHDMCCLGFLGKACGVDEGDLKHYSYLSELRAITLQLPDGFYEFYWNKRLALVNDSHDTPQAKKEQIITAIMLEKGVEVTFEDSEDV